ncbi:ATP-binding protein [Rathayibacter sp. VKM Ac-2754]|uniref:ATP-binding protein n=1 Tax=Rathayibacter sp. VKM Ac-2754 TaxID=2609251 RepID=UPI001F1A0A5A
MSSLAAVAVWRGAEWEVPVLPAEAAVPGPPVRAESRLDFSDVVGNEEAAEAMIAAAAGGHHVFLLGPPGAGKTMLASRLPGILPDLDDEAALEATCMRSLTGEPTGGDLVRRPPFESPHHSASPAAIVGGGSGRIRPGAVARATRGILFLDEAWSCKVHHAVRSCESCVGGPWQDAPMTPDQTSAALDALSAWSTLGTGLVAAAAFVVAWIFGARQVKEAREARRLTADLDRARSQPYVVVSMEPVPYLQGFMDLVIRNYGQTIARNVSFETDSDLKTSNNGEPEFLMFPHFIPALAPGQEYRTFWDAHLERHQAGLPHRHTGTITYDGIDNEKLTTEVVLDWHVYMHQSWITRKGLNELAEAVVAIKKNTDKWTDPLHHGLRTFGHDGAQADATTMLTYRKKRDARRAKAEEQSTPDEG